MLVAANREDTTEFERATQRGQKIAVAAHGEDTRLQLNRKK